MKIGINSLLVKLCIYTLGAGIASFTLVLLINIVGLWFGFQRDENVSIEKIGYFNVILFLISIGVLAFLSYGFIFYLINKIFNFNVNNH